MTGITYSMRVLTCDVIKYDDGRNYVRMIVANARQRRMRSADTRTPLVCLT